MPSWVPNPQTVLETSAARFIARQPILDRKKKTFGYELLFRSGWENSFHANGEIASRSVIDNVLAFDLASLTGAAVPFINCTADLLRQELPTLLPQGTVLEILETVGVDAAVIHACERLSQLGYPLALDDFDFSERWDPLLRIAKFVKVDLRASTPTQRRALTARLDNSDVRTVAEKVETEAEFQDALADGFDLFQGYFFAKPLVMRRSALPSIVQRLRILQELSKAELDTFRLLPMLKQEPSLIYRLLRFANSALSQVRDPVTDLQTALLIVGEREFRKIAMVALTADLCGPQPDELYRTILHKARFCELMAPSLALGPDHMYLFGMLSMIKSSLQLSAETICSCIQLHPQMTAALFGQENACSLLLQCAAEHERGQWDALTNTASHLGQPEEVISLHSESASQWVDQLLSSVG